VNVGDLVEFDAACIWEGEGGNKTGVVLSVSVPSQSNPVVLAIVQFDDERRECRARYLKVISEREGKSK